MMARRRAQKGIALLEALIASVILAIGLLGTIGLQARAYSAMNDASLRAEATIAAERLIGLMSTDQNNLAAYAMAAGGSAGPALLPWYNDTVRAIPGAVVAVSVGTAPAGNSAAVTVKISWKRKPGDATGNTATLTSYLSKSS